MTEFFFILGYGETGEVPVYGTHSILPKEHGAKFFALPIVRHLTREVGAIATWDSSIHDSMCLNTVTSGTYYVMTFSNCVRIIIESDFKSISYAIYVFMYFAIKIG